MEINLNQVDVKIDYSLDKYGRLFWEKLSQGKFEPETFYFLKSHVDNETVFLDVGAANGAMTLYAATLGAKVLSYEPNPEIYRVLSKNCELNPELSALITISPDAVGAQQTQLLLSKGSNSRILSDIVFADLVESASVINVRSLADEINDASNLAEKIVVKIDIEGAEWEIFNAENVLQAFNAKKVLALIALHPGFYRPMNSRFPILRSASHLNFTVRNILDFRNFYKKVSKFGVIKRTNFESVRNLYKFIFLALGGCYEFILDFRQID